MGTCTTKHRDKDGEAPAAGGAAPASSKCSCPEDLSVSLERVRRHSTNSISSNARYHSSATSGGDGRGLADDYEVFPKQVLGEGCNGEVVMARGRHDGRKYALKRIQKSRVRGKALKSLTDEVEIYLTLDHPHIAALRDVYETKAELSLLTECCEGGELYARLLSRVRYTEADAVEAARQMLLAVGYLHAHRVVHRDLKLENFLYEGEDREAPLKLIDFGFAKIWDPTTLMMASCGSIAYVSPDVLKGHGYTSQCDLWSLGVIVFMLLVGYPPFHGSEKELMGAIMAGRVDWSHKSRWKGVSADAIHFVRSLLVKDPDARLDAKAALAHRWLSVSQSHGAPAVLDTGALRQLHRYQDASRLRRAILKVLAHELAPNETRELREAFLGMDKTGEGTVRFSELKDAIRGKRGKTAAAPPPPGSTSPKTPARTIRRAKTEVLNDLFTMLDANGDEQVYYSDFLAATMDTRSHLRDENLHAAFHRLDADSSGTISPEDMRKVLGETFEGVNMETLVQEANLSSHGGVTFKEFLQVLHDTDATPTSAQVCTRGTPAELLSCVP